MTATDRFLLVLTTAGSLEQAETMASELVERRIAACVNIVSGVCSVYRWQGKVNREEEQLLLIKTAERLFPDVQQAIRELHTYEVPEIVTVALDAGDPDYLKWLSGALRDAES